MASSDYGGDNGSFEENTSLSIAAGLAIPAPQQAKEDSIPTFQSSPVAVPATLNPLLAK
ncbi:UNVERIFIED_CONTAM: hypothetical protein Slati_0915400 [Sesamum latifolium]|uniref:Uncharacterized protein n=1 Tax=Sesamum latifolium TaxID=2727402 RepID=A0AAW2XS48_9LAMI